MSGLSFALLDLLIDKYVPDQYHWIVVVSTVCFYIIVSTAFGIVLKKLFEVLLTDNLTGLYTRRYFYPRFAEEMVKVNENKDLISLLMIDTDKFKHINDTYGHMTGDHILKQLARVFKQSVRSGDVVIRWGGEEFLILLPHTNRANAASIAEGIRATIEKTEFYYENNCISVTLSIGTVTTDHEVDMKQFIQLADEMLYKAKERRNIIESLDCSSINK